MNNGAHPLSETALPVRAYRVLTQAGFRTLEEVAGQSREALLALPGFGRGSLSEVEAELGQYGLTLVPDRPRERAATKRERQRAEREEARAATAAEIWAAYESGTLVREIARARGVCREAIDKMLRRDPERRQGVIRARRARPPRGHAIHELLTREEWIEGYYGDPPLSLVQLAERLGIGRQQVLAALRKHGIPRRPRTESLRARTGNDPGRITTQEAARRFQRLYTTLPDACRILGRDKKTIHEALQAGRFPGAFQWPETGWWFIPRVAVEEYAAKHPR